MFGTMGVAALFLVILAICYQAVTWGSEDHTPGVQTQTAVTVNKKKTAA